jgi:hypothetical protein
MRRSDDLPGVERRWPRLHWDGQGRSRWAGWGWDRYLLIVVAGFLLGTTFLEGALARGGDKVPWPVFGWLAESSGGIAILALLLLLNGWLVDRSLADRTPFENGLPWWLRALRRAVASVPMYGLYAIPAWRRVIQTRPAWACGPLGKPVLDLSAPRGPQPRRFRRALSRVHSCRRTLGQSMPALLLWMIVGQIGLWVALLSGLMTAPSLSPGRRAVLQGVSIGFRILACAGGIQYGLLRARQIRAGRLRLFVLRWAPLCFLFGFLAWILGLLPWLAALNEERETLVSRCWLRKSSSSSQALRARWGARPSPLATTAWNSEILLARFAFYRLKLLALFFDAAALAWLLCRRGHPLLALHGFPFRRFVPCLMLAALGLLTDGILLSRRVFGWFRLDDRHSLPYGRFIAFPQLVLAAGALFGSLLALRMETVAGNLLVVIGMGGLFSTLLFTSASYLIDLSNRQTFITLSWFLLFAEVVVVGGLMHAVPEVCGLFLAGFKAAMILAPVWNLALFLGPGGALLHPFRPRHVCDRRLPIRLRATLAATCVTAALPLGAIAIPFWIYAGHWVWRRYEPLLSESAG